MAQLADGKTLTVNATGGGLYLMNFVQLGTTPQVIDFNSNALLVLSGNCTFNGRVSLKTKGQLSVQGSTFNGETTLENAGSSVSDNSNNTFNASAIIINSGSTFLRTGYNKFHSDLTLINSGTSTSQLQFAISGVSTEFKGNVTVNSTGGQGIIIGNATNKAILAEGKTISVGSLGFSVGQLSIAGLTQLSNTSQNLVLTVTASLRITGNSAFNGTVDFKAPHLYLDGATYNASATFTKTAAGANNCQGGNIFKKKVRIVNLASGNSPVNMATVNDDVIN
jgi:hypothetical protein